MYWEKVNHIYPPELSLTTNTSPSGWVGYFEDAHRLANQAYGIGCVKAMRFQFLITYESDS